VQTRAPLPAAQSSSSIVAGLTEYSKGYTPPADACISYQTLYKELSEFEADLHQHNHLENNILFPRAIAMEQGQ
jgi:regulator of cell morphogenesis and NO signaling